MLLSVFNTTIALINNLTFMKGDSHGRHKRKATKEKQKSPESETKT